ncbi:MAG: NYN domain-containing protein [Candidatus Limnocylindria bacterium]
MSKNVAMFVDVANMYYAARGQDVDVDYVALLKHATKGRDLIRAYAYTGLDPENENQRKFIDFLAKNGYKPVVKDIRKFGDGRMKANLDIELVVDLFRLAERMDIAVIVSGDGDFAPAIRALQDKGVRCEVVSFKPNTSSDLIAVADEFQDIMKVASISRKKAAEAVRQSGMSMPEMPAKEVTPEFGFREASPSVAAAALAALKGGSTDGRRTRAGVGRRASPAAAASTTPLAPADQPPGEQVAVPIEGSPESEELARRRRRRRGGRGRGRGRREEGTAAGEAAEAPSGEAAIGWEEFDDISQLEVGAEREYTFEEADAATLAELGLTPEDVVPAAGDDATPADAPAERSTRARSPRARKPASATTDGAGTDEAPKPRRRSPRTAAASGDEKATSGDAPAPRRRGSRAKADAEGEPAESGAPATASGGTSRSKSSEPGGDAEPEGIWGRFRSARKPRSAG